MNDVELDVLLRESAPGNPADGALELDNARILREARTRRSRRAGLWLAGVCTSVLIVGGGSAAMAGAGMETPWGWFADNVFSIERPDGSICFQGMRIDFRGIDQDAPIVKDAQEILRSIDVAGLDTTQTEKDLIWEATRSKNNADPLTPDELKQSAIGTMTAEILFQELAAKGYDQPPVSMQTQTTDCQQ